MPAARAQVMLFLVEAKKLIASSSCAFIRRKKNLDALAFLGWSIENLFDFICTLTPETYVNGPDADSDFPGEDIWTFGVMVEDHEHYIKLKIRRLENGNDGQILCLSFHQAEYPFIYPYKA